MLKNTVFILLNIFLASINSFGIFAIDLAIEAKGESFGWNSEKDPEAYERILPSQKANYFDEGFKKAELYCRQALGVKVAIKNEKQWITKFQENARSSFVVHNVRIRCIKALDLDENDPFIGKYFDHARFLLSNFSLSKLPAENHQLVANTLKILTQIGAQAMPLLWDLHRFITDRGEKSSLLNTLNTIAQQDINALAQIISLTEQYQSKDEVSRVELRQLFCQCKQGLDRSWLLIATAINKNIEEMIDEPMINHAFINNIGSISYLLDGFYYWMLDRSQHNAIGTNEMHDQMKVIHNWLQVLLEEFPIIQTFKDFTDLLALYDMAFSGSPKKITEP